MMPRAEQYPFVAINPAPGQIRLLPYLPMTLTVGEKSVEVKGLLDTGAAVNVLPYDVGLDLGLIWEGLTDSVQLAGNLAHEEARVAVVLAKVGNFPPVRMAFAWSKSNSVPVLLGQVNFFLEFDVCLFRSQCTFEVKPK